jgi:hypothetical protein
VSATLPVGKRRGDVTCGPLLLFRGQRLHFTLLTHTLHDTLTPYHSLTDQAISYISLHCSSPALCIFCGRTRKNHAVREHSQECIAIM